MRIIPPYLSEIIRNSGERRFFEELKKSNLPQEYHAIHSLNLPEHQYKMFGELDFVIVSPYGLYVLEVKSGSVVCQDGFWTIGDDEYSYESEEGPFKQAESGMWSLLRRLERKLKGEDLSGLIIGYGVVFPDVLFDVDGFEWDQDIVLDLDAWKKIGVTGYLKRLEAYWHRKWHRRPNTVSSELVKKIVFTLRPQVEVLRSLSLDAERTEKELNELTEVQYVVLDSLESYQRILVQGGAGTGKTTLALEAATRSANTGKSVLFVCFSPLLASYLRWKHPSPLIEYTSLYHFMLRIVQKYKGSRPEGYYPGRALTDPWFREALAPAFEEASKEMTDEDRYDVLVVDEAQDLLNLNSLVGLSCSLRSGIENGTWRMFYDPINQSSIIGQMEEEVISMVSDLAGVKPNLTQNRRNTDPVLLQTILITGTNPAGKSNIKGPDVTLRFYFDRTNAAKLLAERLDELFDKKVSPSKITILSPYPFEESSAATLPLRYKRMITVLDGSSEDIFPFPGLTFSTLASFKGLENQFIVFIDLDNLDSTPAVRSGIYVGMTRPCYHLWMSVSEKLRPRLKEIMANNAEKVLEYATN